MTGVGPTPAGPTDPMDVHSALGVRRSCRAYREEPVPPDVLDRILDAARRAPSAGNTWALDLVVLEGPDETAGYWDTTLPAERRGAFPWPGLLRAPVLVVVVTDPAAYVDRYAEADKARTGLGEGEAAWPVPYWWVDAGAAVMAVLLAATAEGLGSLLFGIFDHEAALAGHLGVPDGHRLVGTVALGWPDPSDARPSASATRRRPALDRVVRRGRW